jgi:Aspartyl/Asparaginyl beta-hydroxylase
MPNADPSMQLRAGLVALQAGDHVKALALLRPLGAANPTAPQLWMALAEAERLGGDQTAFLAAVDQLIRIEPMAVRAYGWKGDIHLARGDQRGAASWYREGVNRAALMDRVPEPLSGEVVRQQAALDQLNAAFAEQLNAGLHSSGVNAATLSDRFAESISILNGKANVQLQKPTTYYFPGLPQRAFYERDEFDWVSDVEAATNAVAAELATALAGHGGFAPYLTVEADRPDRDTHGMTGNANWSSLELTVRGEATAEGRARFPKTWAMLDQLPLCRIAQRAPTPMFSLLKPGARIPPHHGAINCRLICHLPLVVPGNGALRVGNQTRLWERGKLLIFDDSIEHEAWNDAASDRIVLIFDIWHPMVSEAERSGIDGLFQVIDGSSS